MRESQGQASLDVRRHSVGRVSVLLPGELEELVQRAHDPREHVLSGG